MAGEGPPFLTVGTAVSAKYRGAFCEAKVKVVKKLVKCKINFKSGTSCIVNDDSIRGTLKVGVIVEAKQTEHGPYEEGTIVKLTDASLYTVVFDDGDEKTLRRTLLCMQGEKHFHESETLDHLPLTDPENFGTPVMRDSKKIRRKRRMSNRSQSEDEEDDDDSDSDSSPKKQPKDEPEDAVGKVVIIEMNEKRKNSFFPALVVDPSCTKDVQMRGKDQVVVRSFKDNKFYTVSRSSRKAFLAKDHTYKGDVASLKAATEKAVTFIDTGQLPSNWDVEMLKKKLKHGTAEWTDDTSEDSSDDEYDMEKDAWLASLHKFMEERGTPINKPPVLGYRDLNLYKLYKLAQDQGGCRKVTDRQLWRHIMTKMGIPPSVTLQPYNIHTAYNKYLFAFEEFNRKMGPGPRVFTRTRRRSFDRGWISPPIMSRQRSLVKQDVKDDPSDEEEEEEEPSPSKKRVTRKKTDDSRRLAEPEETKRETRDAKARAKEQAKEQAKEEKDSSEEEKKAARKSQKDAKLKDKPKDENAKERVKEDRGSEKQSDEKGRDKMKGEAKGREKMKDDKSKDTVREDKGKEKPKEEKVREKAKEEKVKERAKEEKVKEKSKEERVKERAKEEKVKEKVKERAKEEKVKERAKEEKVKEKSKEEKVKEKVKERAKEEKVKERAKEEKVKEKSKEERVKERAKEERVKERAKEEKVKEKVKERAKEEKVKDKPKEEKSKEKQTDSKGKDKKAKVKGSSSKDEPVKEEIPEVGAGYNVGEKVLVQYGRGRTEKIYEAKVVDIELKGKDHIFTVHYTGWNNRYDETVRKNRIVGSAEKKKKKLTLKSRGDKDKYKKDIEKKEKEEQERKDKEEMDRKEREEHERKERLERELKEKQEREKEKNEKEKLEKEKRERLEKERKEREKKEKLERERAEKERREKLERDRKEKQEREKKEKLERERKEKLERELKERQEKERKEKLEKERLEREKRERQEKEKKERLEKERIDKLEREKKEKEKLEQEKREKEVEKAKAEKERKEKEKLGKESKRTPNSKRGRPSIGKASPSQQSSPRSSVSGRGKSLSPASVFSQRSMRSDRKSVTESPFAGGLNIRSRPRRSSGPGDFSRDTGTQEDSDSDLDEADVQSESQQSSPDSEDTQLKDMGAQEEGNEDSETSKTDEDAAILTKVSEESLSFNDDIDDGPPKLTAQVGPEASEMRPQDEESDAPKVEEVGMICEEKEIGKARSKKESKLKLRKSSEKCKDSSKEASPETRSDVKEETDFKNDGIKEESERGDDKYKIDETPILERQVPVEAEVRLKMEDRVEEVREVAKESASDAEKQTEKKKSRKKGRRSIDRKRGKSDLETEDPEIPEPKKKHSKVDRRKSDKEVKKSNEQEVRTAADNADSDFGTSSVEDKSLPGTSKSFMTTTPPTTPESSPKMPSSPSQEEAEEEGSIKSDSDDVIEVANIDDKIDDKETSRSDAVDMSSLNLCFPNSVHKIETSQSEPFQTSPKKRRRGASESDSRKKCRKQSRRQSSISERRHSSTKDCGNNSSDTDESRSESQLTASVSKHQLPARNTSGNLPSTKVTESSRPQGSQRQPRWNFLVDLSDVKEPDERIAIIQRQLSDLRQVYMQLKQEVASIDRRRKKFRKKEREAAQTMAGVALGHCISQTSDRMDPGGS